jgi:Xaa-Pro aminopeptidase
MARVEIAKITQAAAISKQAMVRLFASSISLKFFEGKQYLFDSRPAFF